MTKKEIKNTVIWNQEITKKELDASKIYDSIHDKYFKLNHSASCSYSRFILEIAETKDVTTEQKVQDIEKILNYMLAKGELDALFKYLSIIR